MELAAAGIKRVHGGGVHNNSIAEIWEKIKLTLCGVQEILYTLWGLGMRPL